MTTIQASTLTGYTITDLQVTVKLTWNFRETDLSSCGVYLPSD